MPLPLLLLAAQTALLPTPAVLMVNPSAVAQHCVLTTSLPLPHAWRARTLRNLSVGETPALWAPLLLWPDRSLAVVQLQWRVDLDAHATRRALVHCEPIDELAAHGSTPANDLPSDTAVDAWFAVLPLRAELVDPWGRTYIASLPGSTHATAGLVLTQHSAAENVDAATGAALFTSAIELHRVRGDRLGQLTLTLSNGRDGSEPALGPARFTSFSLLSDDPHLRLRPQHARANLLPEPVAMRDTQGQLTGFRHQLLASSVALYLGDTTAKAWRFDVCYDANLTPFEASALDARASSPPFAFADLDWVRWTGAFSLFGGPGPVASTLDDLSSTVVGLWQRDAEFGPFGGFGDPKPMLAPGSAHNAPMLLHNVVRWRSHDLLRVAQARALASTLRPLPGTRPRLPEATAALRQGLSTRALEQPHGFEVLDYEHVSVDLLLDLYWLTGDQFARDELARHGRAIRALLERLPCMTSRGEGVCAQALAAVAWATDDDELLAWAVRRAHAVVLPRLAQFATVAIAQPPHPAVLGGDAWFDAPWQMAALVHGLAALHRRSGDPDLAAAAIDVARKMATHGWTALGPKYFLHAGNPERFCMARGEDLFSGRAMFCVGAFVLAAELARDDQQVQSLFAARAAVIVAAARQPQDGMLSPITRADPWLQLWLDRQPPRF